MSDTPYRYTAELAERIELAWQDRWQSEGTFHAPNPAGPWADPEGVAGREKLFVLDMFPYPSGAGLHVGHPLGFIATDVYARYQRMTGKNVLHTLGYDAFRAAGRAVCRADRTAPAQDHRREHGHDAASAAPAGTGPRRPPRDRDDRPRVLPVDPVDLRPDLQQLV
jgi:valyl-tRNA synthetase